jgi:hypothetical protein
VVFHVAFGFGKELDATGLKEPFCQCFGDLASVSKDLAIEALKQVLDGLAVVGIARQRFEVLILLLMEAHQDCHDLAQAQRSLALTVLNSFTQQQGVPFRLELLAKIINMAKQLF